VTLTKHYETTTSTDSGRTNRSGNATISFNIAKACQILGKILDRAVKSGHISSNPCRHVKRPKPTKSLLSIITEIEIARLAGAIHLRFRASVYLACYGGLRAGELFGLKRSNVELSGRRVLVSNTAVETNGRLHIDQPPKSDAGRRTMPLSRVAAKALAAHAEMYGNRPDDYVFPNEEGNPMRLSNFRNRFWKPALKRAGIDPSFRIHDQKHSAISLWIKAGINVKDVSVHAGHTSVAFTLDRYGHLYPDNGDAFLRALDAATDQSLGISGHDSGHEMAPILNIKDINSVTRDNEWALRDSNPRPQPRESVLGGFGDLGVLRKVQLRGQMNCPLVSGTTPYSALLRARSAHAGPSFSGLLRMQGR